MTFLILLAAAYLAIQFVFRAGVPIYYGQAGVQNYLSDYLRLSVPLGVLWMASLIWIISRRSASYFGPITIGILSGIVFGSMIWIPYQDMPLLALIGGGLTGVIVMLLVRMLIKILGFCDKQIVCVKRKKWDWSKAASGIFIGIVFILLISMVSDVTRAMFLEGMGFWPAVQITFSFNTIVWWNWGVPGLLSLSAFFFLVLGLGWGEVVLRDEVDSYFGETDETVNRKLHAAMKIGLIPIVCVGETLDQYEAGRTDEFVRRQINLGFVGVDSASASRIVDAYEPVWAIGTGKASSGESANGVVKQVIRLALSGLCNDSVAQSLRVLYGGSVTAANASEFFSQPEIDGALVGGASLKPDEFVAIAKAAAGR